VARLVGAYVLRGGCPTRLLDEASTYIDSERSGPDHVYASNRLELRAFDRPTEPVQWHHEKEGPIVALMGRIYPVDTENQAISLAAGFSSQGASFFTRLNGEFSIVLFDPGGSELYLVRDHFGSRPLYYRCVEGVILFSTDLTALARTRPRPNLDRTGIAEILVRGRRADSKTIFEGVQKVRAGYILTADQQGFEESMYWDASAYLSRRQEGLSWEAVWQAIADSTKARMHAVHSPPFAYLSGGIDSSTVCGTLSGLARQQLSSRIVTLSVGAAKKGWDEGASALRASAHIGSTHRSRTIDWNDFRRTLQETIMVGQEPPGGGVQYYCAAVLAASEGAEVVFSGDGGDELFGGYPSWVDWAAADAIFSLVCLGCLSASSKRLLRRRFGQGIMDIARGPGRLGHIIRLWKILIEGIVPGYFLLRELSKAFARSREVLSDSFIPAEEWGRIKSVLNEEILEAAVLGPFNSRRLLGVRSNLPGGFRAFWYYHQANSLVPTYPLMDRTVVELALSSSPAELFHNPRTKDLLRSYLEKMGFPPEITQRTKIGFSLPVEEWYANELRGFAETAVSNGNLMRDGILNPEAVRALVRKNDPFLADLVNMEIWYSLNIANGAASGRRSDG